MKYREFGSTGRRVSAIGLGAMPVSVTANRPDESQAIAVIHHAVDCGITLIDTADSYCLDSSEVGHNERVVGKAVSQLPPAVRDELLVATKGGLIRPQGRWERLGTREHLRRACEHSLAALGVERIDLYQYHAIDPNVPLAESIGELKLLADEGKIAHIGVSNHSVSELDQARAIVPVVSIQNQYSRQQRAPETDGTLAASQARGVAFIAWSPLNGMGGAKTLGRGQRAVRAVAKEHGVSVQQVVLAWLVSKGPMVFPIPGASRKRTIEDSARAADLVLSDDQIRRLDES